MKNILRKSNFGFKNWITEMALLRSEPRKLNRSFGGLRASLLLALTAGWMGMAQAQDIVAGWDFQTTTSGGTAVLASPNTQTVFNANVGAGTLYLNGSEGSSTWASATELNAFTGTAINAANGLSTTTTLGAVAVVGGGALSLHARRTIVWSTTQSLQVARSLKFRKAARKRKERSPKEI